MLISKCSRVTLRRMSALASLSLVLTVSPARASFVTFSTGGTSATSSIQSTVDSFRPHWAASTTEIILGRSLVDGVRSIGMVAAPPRPLSAGRCSPRSQTRAEAPLRLRAMNSFKRR